MKNFLLCLLLHVSLGCAWCFLFAWPKTIAAFKAGAVKKPWYSYVGILMSNILAWPAAIARWKFLGYLSKYF